MGGGCSSAGLPPAGVPARRPAASGGGVAILMLMEEGKVRLADPVSRFIPQFKNLKVAGVQPAPAGGAGGGGAAAGPQGTASAAPRFYTVPAEREITIKDLLTHTSG